MCISISFNSFSRSIDAQCCAHTRYTATIWWSQTSISTYLNIQFYRIRSLIMILSPPSTGWRSPSRMNSIFGFFFGSTPRKEEKHLNIWLCQNESDWMLCVSFGIVYIRTIDILYIYMYYNEHTAQHIQKYFGWFSSNIDHFHIIIVYEQLTKQHRMDGRVILTVCALCRCSVFRCGFLPFSVQISMEMLVA